MLPECPLLLCVATDDALEIGWGCDLVKGARFAAPVVVIDTLHGGTILDRVGMRSGRDDGHRDEVVTGSAVHGAGLRKRNSG